MFTGSFTLTLVIHDFYSEPRLYDPMGNTHTDIGHCTLDRRRAGGLIRNSSGSAPIEFALFGSASLLLIFGVFAASFLFVANMTLDNAVDRGARVIRTGEAQTQGFDAARFKSEVCKYLTAPLSCSGLKLDVRTCSSFGGCQPATALDSSGNLNTNLSYNPGAGGDIVIVKAFYEWDFLSNFPVVPLPIMSAPKIQSVDTRLSNMPNGNRVLIATAVFRNEPFKLQ
jgi:Flp pilus assembly protein TadG